MNFGFKLAMSGVLLAGVMNSAANAGEPLTVQVDKTQLLTVSEQPGTVVIGNPTMADVTINGKQIFLHGHAFGDTNLIILDKSGRQIANFDLTVTNNVSNAVAVYNAGVRSSYTCAPLCEVTMQVGDPNLQSIVSANQIKTSYASGKTSGQAAAPQAVQ